MTGFMLDTTVFNEIANGKLKISRFETLRVFATHVQIDELERTPDPVRRARLKAIFSEISAKKVPTSSFVWNVSKWNGGKLGDGKLFNRMLSELQALDRKSNRAGNQASDILIAETAIKNRLILVSKDKNLRLVAEQFGCAVRSIADFETQSAS